MLNIHKISFPFWGFQFKLKESKFGNSKITPSMIQRIQSVYLFLISVFSAILMHNSIILYSDRSGSVFKFSYLSLMKSTGGQGFETIEKLWPFTVILIAVLVLSLITIFFFKKRNVQVILTGILIGFISFLNLAALHNSYLIISRYSASIIPGIKMILPLIMLILSILAYKGIKKDDRLVKSYDRLR